MKTKLILVGSVVVVMGAVGTWVGRAVWARQRGLVTVEVRNAPLSEVIRTIERQTGEKIAVDRRLDGLVTLDMSRKPLPKVLDRVAEQCGASWRTVHAVYESRSALPELESSLYGDKTLNEVGWKMIAPAALIGGPIDLRGGQRVFLTNAAHAGGLSDAGDGGGGGGGPVRVMIRGGQGAPQVITETGTGPLPAGASVETEDAVVQTGTNGPGGIAVRRQQSPAVVRVVRKKGDGGNSVEEEIWTPIEVVLEARLSDRLSDFSGVPTFEAAREAATKVKGHVKTYYALRKSPFGMGMSGMSFSMGREGGGRVIRKGDGTSQGGAAGTNVAMAAGRMPSTSELEAAMAERRSDELGKLTPEQRVLRARERQQSGKKQ